MVINVVLISVVFFVNLDYFLCMSWKLLREKIWCKIIYLLVLKGGKGFCRFFVVVEIVVVVSLWYFVIINLWSSSRKKGYFVNLLNGSEMRFYEIRWDLLFIY